MDSRKNKIAFGGALFAALLLVTLWALNRRDREPTSASEVPTIDIDRDTITAIEVERPGGEIVVLSNASGEWRVASPLDAEADESNLESALNRLADLELTRVVATQAQNYERLQVDDANAVRVTAKAGEQTVAELAIGKYASGMTMIRIDDRVEVFGASGSLRYAFDRELKAWRNRKVVSVESGDVQSIAFESANGSFTFDRSEKGWAVSKGGKALKNFDPNKVAGLVSTAARLIASGFGAEDISPARAGLTEPNATVSMTVSEQSEPIVLEVGDAADQPGEVYLRRRGTDTIYLVSQYLADRLRPEAKAFERTEEPPPPPTAMPEQGQGQPRLPPEVMQQLQEQIRQQQQQQQR